MSDPKPKGDNLRGVAVFPATDREEGFPVVTMRAWYNCIPCGGSFVRQCSLDHPISAAILFGLIASDLGLTAPCPRCERPGTRKEPDRGSTLDGPTPAS